MAKQKVAMLTAGGLAPCLSSAVGGLIERYTDIAPEIELIAYKSGFRGLLMDYKIEITKEMREKARAEGRPVRYDGRWRDRDPATAPDGVKPVIRLRAPERGGSRGNGKASCRHRLAHGKDHGRQSARRAWRIEDGRRCPGRERGMNVKPHYSARRARCAASPAAACGR